MRITWLSEGVLFIYLAVADACPLPLDRSYVAKTGVVPLLATSTINGAEMPVSMDLPWPSEHRHGAIPKCFHASARHVTVAVTVPVSCSLPMPLSAKFGGSVPVYHRSAA